MPGQATRQPAELLEQLADDYRHVQQEHVREAPGGTTRRGLEAEMRRIAARFERALEHWVQEEALAEAWRRCLHDGAATPEQPRLAQPPLFKGVDEAGAAVEVRAAGDGGYDILVDGSLSVHEAVPWHLDPDLIEPVEIHGHRCSERFAASPAAVAALADFFAHPGTPPPLAHARELYEDGLTGAELEITPRGQRLLAAQARQPTAPRQLVRFGVLVADAARARMLILDAPGGALSPTTAALIEVGSQTNPERRARDAELLSDTRPGLQREGPGLPRHGVSDRRDERRHATDQRFANAVAAEAVRRFRAASATRVVIVAGPSMLGHLRVALAREDGEPRPYTVEELGRDLSRLAAPALHDAVAAAGLLPPRSRLPSLGPPLPGTPVSG